MNLFQTKRTGAAMVCVVLAGAVLAGGLVASESAGAAGSGDPAVSAPPSAPTETAQAGKEDVYKRQQMTQGQSRFVPYEMKRSLIRVYSYRNKEIRGTLQNPYFEEEPYFDNLTQLLKMCIRDSSRTMEQVGSMSTSSSTT